ncbi:DMT family transporter [Terasakiella sp. A23]|uniref:DMT family transporter n=1 Tax=Terasakiella sp. FCG-A23 TaxID=3080561 RepID=UPI0029557FD7|nr:DMT family transporter [Terasakiella sp. A23]MDV7339104.1 DMT family transporter [Terasakiella sp. A23]
MEQSKTHLDAIAMGILLVCCISWGLQQIAVKWIIADISPVMQAALRSTIASVLIASLIKVRGKKIFEKDGTLWWGIGAGLLFGGEFMLIYWGLEFTNASRAVVFLYIAPFVVAIGSQILFPSEKLNRLQFAGLACSFLGLIVAFGESLSLPDETMLIGDMMLIVAAVLWGATTLLIKAGPLAKTPPSKTLFYQLCVSAVMLFIGTYLLGEPGIIRLSEAAIYSMIYQTVWVAAMTYTFWFWLIKHYPAPKLSSFSFLTPLFGVFAGIILLDEPLTVSLIIAMCLVAAGIYLVNRPQA